MLLISPCVLYPFRFSAILKIKPIQDSHCRKFKRKTAMDVGEFLPGLNWLYI